MNAVITFAGTLALIAGAAVAQTQEQAELALSLVNEDRAKHDLPPLEADAKLAEAAREHAKDMLERDYYSHTSPDGAGPRDRYIAADGSRWRVVAENLGRCSGCQTVDEDRIRSFQEGWMQSPGHRENILARGLEEFGFGIASDAGTTYMVQTFAGSGTPPHANDGVQPARAEEQELQAAAIEAANETRAGAEDAAIEGHPDLHAAARSLAEDASVEGDRPEIPSDLFERLPDGAEGWRALSVEVQVCGGCGPYPAEGDGAYFGRRLAPETSGAPPSHAGFAVQANGEGRKIVVMIYGTRS